LGGEKYKVCHEAGGSAIAVSKGVNSKNLGVHTDSKLTGVPVRRVSPSVKKRVEAARGLCKDLLWSHPKVYFMATKSSRPCPYLPIESVSLVMRRSRVRFS